MSSQNQPARRRRMQRAFILICTLLVALALVLGSTAAMANSNDTTSSDTTSTSPLVVLGTNNLTWADVQACAQDDAHPKYQQAAQALLDYASLNQPVNLVVRTNASNTTPAAGWQTLGAGNRNYAETPAVLADSLTSAGASYTAIGTGAQQALTSSDGVVPENNANLSTIFNQAKDTLDTMPNVLIADTTPTAKQITAAPNPDAARILTLANALNEVSGPFPILLVSVADSEAAGLQIGVMPAGVSFAGPVEGPSTHQEALLQLSDITATILASQNAQIPSTVTGLPLTISSTDFVSPGRSIPKLVDDALHARTSQRSTPLVGTFLIGAFVLLIGFAFWTLRQQNSTDRERASALRHVWDGSIFVLTLTPLIALMNASYWWQVSAHGDTPSWQSIATVLAVSGLVAGVVTAVGHRLFAYVRVIRLGLPLLLAFFTALLLLLDGATGARLAFNGPLGMNAVVAGRFYGMNNTAFAQAGAALVAAVGLFSSLILHDESTPRLRRIVLGMSTVVLAAGVLLDGAGPWGADVGGALTLIPVSVILLAGIARWRLSWRRLLAIGLGTVVLVAGLGLADYSRPPAQRTHLGRFIEQVLNGTALTTIGRKATALVSPFWSSPIALLALLVGLSLLGVCIWLLRGIVRQARTGQGPYAWLLGSSNSAKDAVLDGSSFRATLISLSLLAGLEVFVNDSGAVMFWFSAAVGVPTVLAIWLESQQTASGND